MTHELGDVVLAAVQFVDIPSIKKRPALVLFEEQGNIIVAAITSNTRMQGIPLTEEEGAKRASVIKLNYVFTIAPAMVEKQLFELSAQKKRAVVDELTAKLR